MLKKLFVVVCILIAFGSTQAFAERALETEGVDVLGNGNVDLEVGVEYLENRQLMFDTSRVSRERLALPATGFSVGIGERVEIQGDFDAYYLDEDGRDETYDVGDFVLWTKIKLFGVQDGMPGMGLRFGAKLPNASTESRLGTDETDFLGHLIFEYHIGRLQARANAGIGILGNPNENNTQDDVLIYGGALLYPVSESVTLFSEIFGQGLSNEDNNYSSVRGGFILDINENFTFDLAAQAGLTDESEDWGAGGGLTWHFTGLNLE